MARAAEPSKPATVAFGVEGPPDAEAPCGAEGEPGAGIAVAEVELETDIGGHGAPPDERGWIGRESVGPGFTAGIITAVIVIERWVIQADRSPAFGRCHSRTARDRAPDSVRGARGPDPHGSGTK